MTHQLLRRLAWFSALVVGGYAAYFGFWRYQIKRYQVVAPGVLIRSAQPTEYGLQHLIGREGVKTVVSLQLFDFRLHRGWFDPNESDGAYESEFVRRLGARAVQWPMGDETCWPFPDPWEFEEFFLLLDDPANRPVLIHCMGGRHRTGTLSALYRLEYDRWTPEAALAEMYSFSFGKPIPLQELNLRTYRPRPLPDDSEWPAVAATFELDAAQRPADAVPILTHRIRADDTDGPWRRKFRKLIDAEHGYVLPLASRTIENADDPLLAILLPRAREVLSTPASRSEAATAAAALIADFGSPADQQFLVDVLQRESTSAEPSPFYEALVCGITNRYTTNRLPFLRPLLDDLRPRLDPRAKHSYAATAVARVAVISDAPSVYVWTDADLDRAGRTAALDWLAQTPDATRFVRLTPRRGNRDVLVGSASQEEDLSRMRR